MRVLAKSEAVSSIRSSVSVRYGVAVVAVALALGLKLLIDPLVVQDTPFLLVFAAIMVSAWFGGLGPGVFAPNAQHEGRVITPGPPPEERYEKRCHYRRRRPP